MIYDRTDKQVDKMPKEDLAELYKNLRDARRDDDKYFDGQRRRSLREGEAAYEKLKTEYKEKLEELKAKGFVTIEEDFSVDERAEQIKLRASLAVTKDDLEKARALHVKTMNELKRDGKVLDGAERYYLAETEVDRLEDRLYDAERHLNHAYNQIGDLEQENAVLTEEVARLEKNRDSIRSSGIETLKCVTDYIETHPEDNDIEFFKTVLPVCKAMIGDYEAEEAGGGSAPIKAEVVAKKDTKGKNRAREPIIQGRVQKRARKLVGCSRFGQASDDDIEEAFYVDSD